MISASQTGDGYPAAITRQSRLAKIPCEGPALADDGKAGLAVVKELGVLNQQALACSAKDAAAHAKLLMLAHTPKTPRFGAAYEEATHQSYLAQPRASALPRNSATVDPPYLNL